MKLLKTEVQRDFLERLLRVRPAIAIAELVWNSLDADATQIDIAFEKDFSDGLTAIEVRDNGTGISEVDAETGFRNLGGSWKRSGGLTRHGRRSLHGKAGEGRFSAFAIGADVEWSSTANSAQGRSSLSISASRETLGVFRVSDTSRSDDQTGTVVRVTALPESTNILLSSSLSDELTERFALYLRQYPDVVIAVAGKVLDPASLEVMTADYPLGTLMIDGRAITDALLTVVEWRSPTSRSLYLCNGDGVARASLSVSSLRAPGFDFTGYLRSSYVQELYDSNDLLMGNTHPAVDALHQAAIGQLKEHFRRRAAERDSELVTEWKERGIYPYEGEATSPVERTERQVFDVVAVSVNAYLPDFSSSDKRSQQFSFRLLRQAIESSPESMQRILTDVLGLPKNRLDELAELLEKTTLSAIIAASKLVADRLGFLHSLEIMLFDTEPKKQLLERRQLHRILADHTWIFGEEYNLSVDDESLTAVLQKHVKLLGRSDVGAGPPVRGVRGNAQIVDLMLSRRIPQTRAEDLEHLVVELKRPSQKVDQRVFTQISNYALAVARDERFRDVRTTWVFWALSTDRDPFVESQANSPDRPRGMIGRLDPRISIWAKSWAEVINEAKSRLEFFRKQLNYSVDRESALDSLRKTHEKYFPPSLKS